MTREEAIQILSTRDAHGVLCGYTSGVTEAIDMAIEALSADVIEVVRCKDCKHSEGVKCSMYYAYGFKEEDYCSYGERREE